MIINNEMLSLKTKDELAFEDITDRVIDFVERSKVNNGLLNIQTLHTTCSIIVNENEPLLIEDMKNNF